MLSRGRAEGMTIDLEAKRLPAMGVEAMNQLIWLVGAVVIIVFVLGYLGLR